MMVKTPTVKDWMKKAERTLNVKDSMVDAIRELARSPLPSLLVVDDDGNVVGVLTEKDCLRTVCHWAYESSAGGYVGDYMSPLEVILTPDMDLLTASRAFLECNFSCLPVVEGEKTVGGLERHNLLRAIDKWASAINKERERLMATEAECERPTAIEHMQRVAASHSPDQLSEIFRRH
jgi:predicted transcriptional regulator